MKSVGVRKLRHRASELLRLVQRGEVLQITDRGRPVALLSPLPAGGPLELLRLAGDVRSATADLKTICPSRSCPSQGRRAPSTVLGRLRRDDR